MKQTVATLEGCSPVARTGQHRMGILAFFQVILYRQIFTLVPTLTLAGPDIFHCSLPDLQMSLGRILAWLTSY